MKRTSSMALFNDSERRVTRAQIQFIKSIFPLLLLPAELRELIYSFCFSFEGMDAYFDKLYAYVKSQAGKERAMTRVAKRKTPTVLLINRQIFSEAIAMMRRSNLSVSFKHGLLNQKLCRIITVHPLRQLTSIEVSDDGHRLLEKDILANSWHGYMRLLKGLAEILEKGHNLKNFTVRFTDPRLREHVTICAQASWDCGFRDQMREACESLRKLRGIKNVNFVGIDAGLAKELKYRMQSNTTATFFSLPREIRDKIYSMTGDWSEASKMLDNGLANWKDSTAPFTYPAMSTPNVLLINKQIHAEARAVLYKKPLNITFPNEDAVGYNFILPRLTKLIAPPALQNVKTLNITLGHWKWAWTLIKPLSLLLRQAHGLSKLTIAIKVGSKQGLLQLPREDLDALPLHKNFRDIAAVRSLTQWGASGDICELYIAPLVHLLVANGPMKKQWYKLPISGTQLGALVYGGEREHEITPREVIVIDD